MSPATISELVIGSIIDGSARSAVRNTLASATLPASTVATTNAFTAHNRPAFRRRIEASSWPTRQRQVVFGFLIPQWRRKLCAGDASGRKPGRPEPRGSGAAAGLACQHDPGHDHGADRHQAKAAAFEMRQPRRELAQGAVPGVA